MKRYLTAGAAACAAACLLTTTMATMPSFAQEVAAPQTATAVPLATWQTNGTVWSIEVVNGVAYVGGSFTTVRPPGAARGTQEVARKFLAAFDAVTGDLLPWNPIVAGTVSNSSDRNCPVVGTNLRECGTVWDIKKSPDGTRIYVGGDFTSINGSSRVGVAGFNTATGALDPIMKPGVFGRVYALAVSDDTVFAGGAFNSVSGGLTRTKVAAFSRTTSQTLPFAPVLDGNVRALTLSKDQSRLVMGGWFNTINGVTTRRLGAVYTADGTSSPWASPNTYGTNVFVTDLLTVGDEIYATGDAQGSNNEGVDVYNPMTGQRVWTDNCRGASHSVAVMRGVVYAGSHCHDASQMVNGFVEQFNSQDPETQRRYKLRAEVRSGSTAELLHWTPQTDDGNGPRAMAVANDEILWVGGEFTLVNDNLPQQGLTRFGFAPTAPQASPRGLTAPTVFSSRPGRVTVTFPTGEDRDSRMLTYQVIKDGNGAAPVHEVTLDSRPWAPGWYSWDDTAVAPGAQHTYELRAVDPDGNRGPRTAPVAVTVAEVTTAAVDVAAVEKARLRYRLDEATGPARESVGGVRVANAGAGATFGGPGVPGLPGTSVTFSGAAGGALGDPTREWGKKQISVELWFQTTTTRGGKLIGMGNQADPSRNSGNSDRNVYLTNDGRVAWGLNSGSRKAILSQAGLNDGQWHHVVATLDAVAGAKLFVDGVQVAANPTITWSGAYNGWWRIGGDNLSGWPSRPSSDYFAGAIDEVALYPYPLTGAQAARHFALGAADAADVTPPSVPADVVAEVTERDVALTWGAAQDNDEVVRYRVYRGQTEDFLVGPDSRVYQGQALTWTDRDVPFGEWFYRVAAVDAAGNEGEASAPVRVELVEPAPVPQDLVATKDTWVNSANPAAAAGSSWVLRARGGSSEQVTYLSFALPAAQPGKALDSAVLRLTTSANDWAGSNGTFEVRLVEDSTWAEGTTTWDARPAVSDVLVGQLSGGVGVNTMFEITLTAAELARFAGSDVTLAIVSASSDNVEVASKESPNGKPVLTVLYR
jgi:hypothetical protein